jgi:hypothetical protein
MRPVVPIDTIGIDPSINRGLCPGSRECVLLKGVHCTGYFLKGNCVTLADAAVKLLLILFKL